MPAVLASSQTPLAWASEPAGSAYLRAYRYAGFIVEAVDRATGGPEVRFTLPDRSTVSLRVVANLTNLTPSVNGASLVFGPVALTLDEAPGGYLRCRYDLTATVKPANNQVAWTVTTTGGATVTLGAGGVAEIRDASGSLWATQPAPVAVDKNGAAVAVTATLAAGTLTYTLDNIANNRYPVTIDPTTISTSTAAAATASPQRRLVHVASGGAAIALYYDGSNWQWRSASSPYTTWSSANAVTNAVRDRGLTAVMDASDHVHVVYRTASGPNLEYRKLTYSAGSWSLGSAVTVASGDFGGNGEYLSSAIDSDGRIWVYVMRWTGSNHSYEAHYSADGSSWTNSVSAEGRGGTDSAVLARAGNYIVAIRMHENDLYWRRVSTNGSVGTWSSESSKTSVGLYDNHRCAALADVNGRLVLASAPSVGGTDYAIRTLSYQPGTDAWDTSYTDIGTGTSDQYPALARVGDDIYCVWAEYAASNSYAIVYKKWTASSATWGSKSTLVTSGANRLYVNAGGISSAMVVTWTAGTGSPYDVVSDVVSFGGGAQTLTASLLSDADTFHAATVTPGAVTLTAPLYSDADSFYAATVTPGAVTLTAPLLSDADTFHAATVTPGAVTLTAPLYSDADTFHAATVTPGAVTLTAPLYSDADSFYAAVVTLEGGPQTLVPPLYEDADSFFAATLTYAQALTAPLFSDADTFYGATLTYAQTLTAPLYADADAFYAATVVNVVPPTTIGAPDATVRVIQATARAEVDTATARAEVDTATATARSDHATATAAVYQGG